MLLDHFKFSATLLLTCMLYAESSIATPTAQLNQTSINGKISGEVEQFLGIPYALPPVQELRWTPPKPKTLPTGSFDATQYANACMGAGSGVKENEDCLYLNIVRPLKTSAGARKPVVIFLHGGSLVWGSSNTYDYSPIVHLNDVIGVTFNYRLGAFGFLAHPELNREQSSSGNYGFLDQQAAIAWVKNNIAAFGGDPNNITIQGESAGGWSICGHLVAPGSKNLFNKAILESFGCPSISQRHADNRGEILALKLQCADKGKNLQCMRSLAADKVQNAAAEIPFQPMFVHGTPTFPVPIAKSIQNNQVHADAILAGFNRDEERLNTGGMVGYTRPQFESLVYKLMLELDEATLNEYVWPKNANENTAAELAAAIATDSSAPAGVGGCKSIEFVKTVGLGRPVYSYRFDERKGPSMFSFGTLEMGASHMEELPYLFGPLRGFTDSTKQFNKQQVALAQNMKKYWGNFIRNGNPNGKNLPEWPNHSISGSTLSLASAPSILSNKQINADHHCDFWNTHSYPAALDQTLTTKISGYMK